MSKTILETNYISGSNVSFISKVAKKLEGANDLELRKLRKKVDEAKIMHDDILAQVPGVNFINNLQSAFAPVDLY